MSLFPQFICSTQNESAKAAMESYVRILQQAFEHYKNLWEDYIKLQEKYEQNNVQFSFQAKADEPCTKTETSTPQKASNDHALVQENDDVPLLELDTLNTYSSFNSDICNDSGSSESQLGDNDNHLSKSPVFSRTRRSNAISAKKSLSKATKFNKVMSGTHHNETVLPRCNKKLDISKTHHVETTFLPDGKRLTQSRLVFHSHKHDEQKVSLPNVKLVDTSLGTKQDSTKEISKASVTLKVMESLENNVLNVDEDVIEVSPQRNVKSKRRLRLKRTSPTKQIKKDSPDKNKCHNVPSIMIQDIDFESPFDISAVMKDDRSAGSTTINARKDRIDMNDTSPIKMLNKSNVTAKSIETRKEKQPMISKAQNITLNNYVNNPAHEDETFYLPAEEAANRNDASDFSLNDIENKPPAKKMLLDKFNAVSKYKDEQLNMRCRADRAKLNGWDCWECKQYYENLPLSKEELQKRKNQCSRHRYKYKRPRTPEGFWDLDFPDSNIDKVSTK